MLNKFPVIIIDESTDAGITEALLEAGDEVFSIQQLNHKLNQRHTTLPANLGTFTA